MKQIIKLEKCTAEDIITSVAETVGASLVEDGLDLCFEYPDKKGRGYFRAITFSHGLSALEFIVNPNVDIRFVFDNCDINSLMLAFNVEDDVTLIDSQDKTHKKIEKLNCCLFSSGTSKYYSLELARKKINNIFLLIINRKEFESKLSHLNCDFDDQNRRIFMDLNGVNSFLNLDYFSLEVGKLIEEFRHCDVENFMKPIYLEGKTYEMLTYQIQYFNNKADNENTNKSIRKNTIKKIEKAVEIIEKDMDQRINVHTLAKQVGLNQNTLQSGFKKLHKSSVNEYIKNKRLEMAKVLIEDSDLNITEITYKIGINSRSYFSKLFKEKYGITPSAYIGKKKNQKVKSA